jgi:hypothetical protein
MRTPPPTPAKFCHRKARCLQGCCGLYLRESNGIFHAGSFPCSVLAKNDYPGDWLLTNWSGVPARDQGQGGPVHQRERVALDQHRAAALDDRLRRHGGIVT